MAVAVLNVPGLGDSTEGHWQTVWEEERGDTRRVELGEHDAPIREDWIVLIDQAVRDAPAPIVLTGHSLGCPSIAWWAGQADRDALAKVRGALLVAPPDLARSDIPDAVKGFAPTPSDPLPFPTIVAASSDDPYCPIERARGLAAAWGAEFVDVGPHGHLNAASGVRSWPEGQVLLDRLIAGAE